MNETCSDCPLPATHHGEPYWVRIGEHMVPTPRPLCWDCGQRAAFEIAEKRAS